MSNSNRPDCIKTDIKLEKRICIECDFYKANLFAIELCLSPDTMRLQKDAYFSVVHGHIPKRLHWMPPATARTGKCGPEGKFFKKKTFWSKRKHWFTFHKQALILLFRTK